MSNLSLVIPSKDGIQHYSRQRGYQCYFGADPAYAKKLQRAQRGFTGSRVKHGMTCVDAK